jgi:hypothetical protein
VDLEHSTVERSPRTKRIMSVEGFSVLEDRVVPLPDRKTPPLIFRLGELDVLILAHESARAPATGLPAPASRRRRTTSARLGTLCTTSGRRDDAPRLTSLPRGLH